MDYIQSLFHSPIRKISFEDMKLAFHHDYSQNYYIINTLSPAYQDCLIKNTIPYLAEEREINDLISSYNSSQKTILIYGKNSQDSTAEKKYKQLVSIGLDNVYVYSGGLFEWILLQDIYGEDQFPTTSKVVDILKYRDPVNPLVHRSFIPGQRQSNHRLL